MGDKDLTQEGSISPDVVPLTRAGTAEDAGGALMFMCSRAGAYTSTLMRCSLRTFLLIDYYRRQYIDFRWWSYVDRACDLLDSKFNSPFAIMDQVMMVRRPVSCDWKPNDVNR
jgi:hypothetical protein